MGVRQPDREDSFTPFGVSDKEWNQQVNQTRGNRTTSLYIMPRQEPGWQRMPVYFYLSPEDSHATQEAVIRYTHDDVYKPMPGFKVLVSHFHFNVSFRQACMTSPGITDNVSLAPED